jgi:sec-independent protein translocase protein TatC
MSEQPVNSFWSNVTELIKRMKIVLVVFLVATIIMLVLPGSADLFALTNNYQPLVSVFLKYIRDMVLPDSVKLIALQISDPITLYVMASLVFSISVTIPVFAYQTYKFVVPALKPDEKKAIFPFVSVVSVLFVAGVFFGFYFLFPTFVNSVFPFFSAVGAELMFSLIDFYNMLFFTIIVSGLLFTIPAFFVLLVKFGILNTKMFSNKRKYLYLGMVVLALFISPGATPQGDLYIVLSLIALFEASMLIAKGFEKKRNNISFQMNPPFTMFSNPTCKFCHTATDSNSHFCPQCKRNIK